jgi:two-component system chemotaxis sensor kinase CheA
MDLSELLGPFFEECDELLQQMEQDLLALEAGGDPSERIGNIFRVAHSIKGGAGAFGFSGITEYTHALENLLDAIRHGERSITPASLKVLLESVDVLRAMLLAEREGRAIERAPMESSLAQIRRLLAGEEPLPSPDTPAERDSSLDQGAKEGPVADEHPAADLAPAVDASADAQAMRREEPDPLPQGPGWRILFRPYPGMAAHNTDPLYILRELATLGAMHSRVLDDRLPKVEDINPRLFYLGWEIILHGDIPRERIEDVMGWVMDEAEIKIEPLPLAAEDAAEPPAASLPRAEVDEASEQDEGHKDEETPPQPPPADEGRDEVQTTAPPASHGPTEVPAAPAASAGAEGGKGHARAPMREGGSIRVAIEKVDAIIDLVGELVITQSMLGQFSEEVERDGFHISMLSRLRDGLAQLERNTRELQENVMRIRMLPISVAFNRFPRMVHDVARQLGKQVELQIVGEHTELDKTVLEKIGDPLVHLVRNALDHGLERPEERLAQGKPAVGKLVLQAYHKGGSIVIEIEDDGRGIDKAKVLAKARERGLVGPDENVADERIFDLIFLPGFSTAEKVSDLSGRGVGMDVVKSNIQALGGSLEVKSEPGHGTRIILRLPLTLSIMDGQLIVAGGQIFVLPLLSIVESLQLDPQHLARVAGRAEVYRLREQYIPVIRLHEVFHLPESRVSERPLLVVVEGDGAQVGLMIDDLLGQQQVVIKSLETHFRKVEGLSGSTILGDGTVALILDIGGIFQLGRRLEGRKGGLA